MCNYGQDAQRAEANYRQSDAQAPYAPPKPKPPRPNPRQNDVQDPDVPMGQADTMDEQPQPQEEPETPRTAKRRLWGEYRDQQAAALNQRKDRFAVILDRFMR